MPTATTFTSLSTDLQRYLERGYPEDTTVSAQIPRLINLAERAIVTALKIEGFIVPAISTMSVGLSVYLKPDRWRKTKSMNIGTGANNNVRVPIYPREYEYCRRYWPDSSVTGQPKFYADYGYFNWLVVPTPDTAYNWEVNYYQQPPLLDKNTQSNWLTNFAPNMLLYRTLLEMTMFLKDDNRIPTWEKAYETELQNVNTQDLQKIVDGGSVRNEA